ncbi:MAG: lamin tail domain-containing protein, partial [Chloroflexi bacterium]|nr:lamin tail domain-containing protein [Chloroflexota bacterium]
GVTDVESEVAPFVGDVDVYTINHHGSHTSSNAAFLATLKAEVGINQNSVTNGFGHPNAEVVQRFLDTPTTASGTPLFFQQNPGNPGDTRSDDSLASGIADCDDVTEVVGLPGTMLVVSDGASYQVSSCGFGALTLAADEGGAFGDFPPAIVRVARSPQVPLSTESVTVEADVLDGGTPSVELRWWLGGVEQTPVTMTLTGGATYAATLPALADGSKVAYRVEATDGAAQSALSFAQGYFSGVTPIATLRENDASGVLVPRFYGVRVEGNLTVEPGVFHASVSQIYVQDATGGVQVFDRDLLALSRGDLVRFVGEAEQFAGQTEVNISEPFGNYGHTFVAAGSPPAPEPVTVAQAGEALEGTLVRIDGVSVVSGTIPETGSGNLTISDDGGVTTLTLRIDDTTDIPGAATPTQPFDVIGVVSQFDSSYPFTTGYQLLPRSRADLISDEVNLPPLLIHEIHADPANGAPGDANGDGTRDAEDDEFVELVNTGYAPLDISGWTISDGLSVRHTFAAGTIVPGREAVVVFGGGSPTGAFGNAAANGLVFTASTGGLSLNNTGDTVTVADAFAQVVQQVTYGSAANDNQSLTRDPDFTNTPLVKHTLAAGAGGARWSPGARNGGAAFTVPAGAVILTEALYDPTGADGGLEWVELYNTTAQAIDLSGLALGSGGADYTTSRVQLAGVIQSASTFVVGGPTSSADNANPTFDQVFDFDPDF